MSKIKDDEITYEAILLIGTIVQLTATNTDIPRIFQIDAIDVFLNEKQKPYIVSKNNTIYKIDAMLMNDILQLELNVIEKKESNLYKKE